MDATLNQSSTAQNQSSTTQNQPSDFKERRAAVAHYTDKGMLNSRYKRLVRKTFKKASVKTVFGLRRRAKSVRKRMTSDTVIGLKIAVFVIIVLLLLNY